MTYLSRSRLPLICIFLVMAGPAAAGGGAARAIVGNTVHGFESDGEFYDYYASNGTATSKLNGGDVTHGRWSIQNGNMCISYPGDRPSCYQVELKGGNLDMTDVSTGAVFHNHLVRGNPQHL